MWTLDSKVESGLKEHHLQEIEAAILQLPEIRAQRLLFRVTKYLGQRQSITGLRQIVRERSSRIADYERLWVLSAILDEVDESLILDSVAVHLCEETHQQELEPDNIAALHEPRKTEQSTSSEPENIWPENRGNSHLDGHPAIEVVHGLNEESREPSYRAGPLFPSITVPAEEAEHLRSTSGPKTIGRTDSIRVRSRPHTTAALDGETHTRDRRDKGRHPIRDGVWLELQPPYMCIAERYMHFTLADSAG